MNNVLQLNQKLMVTDIELRKKHALKLEDLNMTLKTVDQIEGILGEFLSDLNFKSERIDKLDCRRRDGFIPNSYNKGGLAAMAFMTQQYAEQWLLSFKNASETLEKCYKYDLDLFKEEKGYKKMTQDRYEEFDEWRSNDNESTVLFSCDLMLTSENSLNVRLCVCVKDAPYHRQYDDKLEYDLEFKTLAGLEKKLKALLKKDLVPQFSQAVRESY